VEIDDDPTRSASMATTETSVLTNLRDIFELENERTHREDQEAARRVREDRARGEAQRAERRRLAAEAERLEREARHAEERERESTALRAQQAMRELDARLETERLVALERVRNERLARDEGLRVELEARVVGERRARQRWVATAVASLAVVVVAAGFSMSRLAARVDETERAHVASDQRLGADLDRARADRDAIRSELDRVLAARAEPIREEPSAPVDAHRERDTTHAQREAPSTSGLAITRHSGPLGGIPR